MTEWYSQLKQKQYKDTHENALPEWFFSVHASLQIKLVKYVQEHSCDLPAQPEIPQTALRLGSAGH